MKSKRLWLRAWGCFKGFSGGFAASKFRATAGTAPGGLRSELGFREDGRRASREPSEDPGVPRAGHGLSGARCYNFGDDGNEKSW